MATEIAVSDVMDLVGLAGADDGAEASIIPPSPILEILSGVWEAAPSAPELPLSLGRLLLPQERQSSLSDPEESPGEGGVILRGPGPCFLPVSTGPSWTISHPGSGGISAGIRPSSMPPTKKRIYLQLIQEISLLIRHYRPVRLLPNRTAGEAAHKLQSGWERERYRERYLHTESAERGNYPLRGILHIEGGGEGKRPAQREGPAQRRQRRNYPQRGILHRKG